MMYEYDPSKNRYRLFIRYKGNDLEYTLQQYHTEIGATYWHLFSKSGVMDLKFNRITGQLSQELISGQQPAPMEFIRLIEMEFIAMNTTK